MSRTQLEKVLKKIMKIIKAGAEKNIPLEKAFGHFDKLGAGAVDEDEFLDGMDRLKITLTPLENRQVSPS